MPRCASRSVLQAAPWRPPVPRPRGSRRPLRRRVLSPLLRRAPRRPRRLQVPAQALPPAPRAASAPLLRLQAAQARRPRRRRVDDPEEVSVTGLLHDLGKVVLEAHVNDVFEVVVEVMEDRNILFYEAEIEVMEINHATVGGWLLQKWQLPGKIVEPVMYHHDFHPSRTHAVRTGIVHLADILVRAEGFGSGGDRRIPVVSEAAMEAMELRQDDLQEIMDEMMEDMRGVIR